MELLRLTDEVYEYYRVNVSGNENISLDQAARKLTRNMLLAEKVEPRNEIEEMIGNRFYRYGNLHFTTRDGTVVHIKNHKGKKCYTSWKLDLDEYHRLSKELGIEEQELIAS